MSCAAGSSRHHVERLCLGKTECLLSASSEVYDPAGQLPEHCRGDEEGGEGALAEAEKALGDALDYFGGVCEGLGRLFVLGGVEHGLGLAVLGRLVVDAVIVETDEFVWEDHLVLPALGGTLGDGDPVGHLDLLKLGLGTGSGER